MPESGKFCLAERDGSYFRELMTKFRDISRMETREFIGKESKVIRNHVIRFADTSEMSGFSCLNDTLRTQAMDCAYQFSVKRDDFGRIHGFIVGDVFFVVWYDPDHKLYS